MIEVIAGIARNLSVTGVLIARDDFDPHRGVELERVDRELDPFVGRRLDEGASLRCGRNGQSLGENYRE